MSELSSGPQIKFVDDARRHRIVELDFPLISGDRTYEKIMVRRLTVQEVKEFQERARAASGAAGELNWPMFFDEAGAPIPDEVMNALDDDDAFQVDALVDDFLPRRFREKLRE